MPLYEFRCRTCDETFEQRRPMSAASEPATCPQGHDGAVRLLSVFASVGASGASSSPSSAAAATPRAQVAVAARAAAAPTDDSSTRSVRRVERRQLSRHVGPCPTLELPLRGDRGEQRVGGEQCSQHAGTARCTTPCRRGGGTRRAPCCGTRGSRSVRRREWPGRRRRAPPRRALPGGARPLPSPGGAPTPDGRCSSRALGRVAPPDRHCAVRCRRASGRTPASW